MAIVCRVNASAGIAEADSAGPFVDHREVGTGFVDNVEPVGPKPRGCKYNAGGE